MLAVALSLIFHPRRLGKRLLKSLRSIYVYKGVGDNSEFRAAYFVRYIRSGAVENFIVQIKELYSDFFYELISK